jgi:hypothetical protein
MRTPQFIPNDIQPFFDNPPILNSENPKLYWELVKKLQIAINPQNVIEWMWLKDAADYGWEAFRLQRMKATTIDIAKKQAVQTVLRRLLPNLQKQRGADVADKVFELTKGWFTDAAAKAEVETVLKIHGLKNDAIEAEAFIESIDKLQAIDELLGIATVRRDASLREIERRREAAVVDGGMARKPTVLEATPVRELQGAKSA